MGTEAADDLWREIRQYLPTGVGLVVFGVVAVVVLRLAAALLKAAHGPLTLAGEVAVGLGLAVAALGSYDDREALLRGGLAAAGLGAGLYLFGLWDAPAD